MRLDKFISEQANVTRSEAKQLLKKGQVTVNGEVIRAADAQISPETDNIFAYGKELSYRRFIYIMLNKPSGVICATRDELSETVLELIPTELRRKGLFPAGRLDKDTEGFVFITDDGALAHKMLSPRSHVEKEYIVTLESPFREEYVTAFANGITIDGGEKCLPATLTPTENERIVKLILHEGKYHQVKRMMKAVGNSVVALKRVRIGGIKLDDSLAEGSCREITADELENLF